MFVRVLFLLLVALNLGAGAWLLFGREPTRAPPRAADPGVPELRLVSEVPRPEPTASTHAPPARPRAPAAVASESSTSAAVASASSPPAAVAPASSTPAAVASALSTSAAVASVPGPRPRLPASMLSAATQASRPTATASVAAAGPAAATTAPATPAAYTCTRLGPFTTTAARQAAIARLSPQVARIRATDQPVDRSRGFLVYLPAGANHAAALEETRALAAKGVRDYFVIGSGDMQNAVSLGVYDSPANAQKRADDLQKLGFAAKVKARVDTQPGYWVDYAISAGKTLDWQAVLPGMRGLQASPIGCF